MKTLMRFSAILLSMLALAGCSTCPCSKKTVSDTSAAPYVPAAATAASVPVAKVVAPAAPVKPAEESIPAAARRYVSK